MKNNNEQIKIMIIGDYLIFRNGLKQLIESESGLKIVSDTVDLMTAPINLTRYSPDVVITFLFQLLDNPFQKRDRDLRNWSLF